MQTNLNTLPTEILFLVFCHLPQKEVANLRLTDQTLNIIATAFLLSQGNKEKLEIFRKLDFRQISSLTQEPKHLIGTFEDSLKSMDTISKLIKIANMTMALNPEALSISDMFKLQMVLNAEQKKIEQTTQAILNQFTQVTRQLQG